MNSDPNPVIQLPTGFNNNEDINDENGNNFLGQVPADFHTGDDSPSNYSEEDITPRQNISTNQPSIFSGIRRKTLPNIKVMKQGQQMSNSATSSPRNAGSFNSPLSVGRTSSENSKKRGKYKIYSEEDKAQILEYIGQYGIDKALDEYQKYDSKLTKRKLKSWIESQSKIKGIKGRKSSDVNRDNRLFEWCIEFQNEHQRAPTRKEAAKKALELSKDIEFKASKGWLDKFSRKYDIEFTPLKVFPSRAKKHRMPGEEGFGSSMSESFETSSVNSGMSPRVNGQDFEEGFSPSSFSRRAQEAMHIKRSGSQQSHGSYGGDDDDQHEQGNLDPVQRNNLNVLSHMLNQIENANGRSPQNNQGNNQNNYNTFSNHPNTQNNQGYNQQQQQQQQFNSYGMNGANNNYNQMNGDNGNQPQMHQSSSYYGNPYNTTSHPYNTNLNPSLFAQSNSNQKMQMYNQQQRQQQQGNYQQQQQQFNQDYQQNQYHQEGQQQNMGNQQQQQQQQNNQYNTFYNQQQDHQQHHQQQQQQQQQFHNNGNKPQDDDKLNELNSAFNEFEIGNYINFNNNEPGSQQKLSMTDLNQKDYFNPSQGSLQQISQNNLDGLYENPSWQGNGSTTFEQMMNQNYPNNYHN